MIGVGAWKKKERGEELRTLYREIYDLEQMTRPQGIPERQELKVKKEELVQLLEQDKKRAFHIVNKERYQWGNKLGKWLGRVVREKKSLSFIKKFKMPRGRWYICLLK